MDYLPIGFPRELLADMVDFSAVNTYCRKYTNEYYEEYHFGHFVLAAYASVPLLLTPDLLYRIWMNFNLYHWGGQSKAIHRIAVADILLSKLCKEVGYELYEMPDSIRLAFLKWLELTQQNPTWKQCKLASPKEIAAFVEKYHNSDNPGVRRWGNNYQDRQRIWALAARNPLEAQQALFQLAQKHQKDGKKIDQLRILELISKHKDIHILLSHVKNEITYPDVEHHAMFAELQKMLIEEDESLKKWVLKNKNTLHHYLVKEKPKTGNWLELQLPKEIKELVLKKPERGTKRLYAAFIGINAYPSKKLYNCVNDALKMDSFLRNFIVTQNKNNIEYHPAYWLAPNNNKEETDILEQHKSRISTFDWLEPTFANIKDQKNGPFAHLTQALDGDICLLYYSGHFSYQFSPPEFFGKQPLGTVGTMVCVDSRSNPEARDLVDKEMIYLIWKALQNPIDNTKYKDVHFLMIMDCNGMPGKATRTTWENSSRKPIIPFNEFLGSKEDFFTINNQGQAEYPIPPYVYLAAARENESALETNEGGLFTSCLLRQLDAGGTQRTYRDLMSELAIEVRNRSEKQNPIAYASDDKLLDRQFLTNDVLDYQANLYAYCIQGEWRLNGGKNIGITPSSPHSDTLIQINGVEDLIKVIKVKEVESILDSTKLLFLDQDRIYPANLKHLSSASISVGFSEGLIRSPNEMNTLFEAYKNEPPVFFKMGSKGETNDYIIDLNEGNYFLTKSNSTIPLFQPEKNPYFFLKSIDSVGKWCSALALKNENTRFSADDFLFTVEKVEGFDLEGEPDKLFGEKVAENGVLPDELIYKYKTASQPAFRLGIAIHPASNLQRCYIGALYFSNNFRVDTSLITSEESLLDRGFGHIFLTYKNNYKTYRTIPLYLNKENISFKDNEDTHFVKIVITDDPKSLTLENLGQKGLPMFSNYRSASDELGFDNIYEHGDWVTFTMKIRAIREKM